jgi:hypothetical protein
VVAATRLVNDLEAVRDTPSEEETAAIIAAEEMSALESPVVSTLKSPVAVTEKKDLP